MKEVPCQNLHEVIEHPVAAQLLNELHTRTINERFRRVELLELLSDAKLLREAVEELFRCHAAFRQDPFRQHIDHGLELVESGLKPPLPLGPFEPMQIQERQVALPEDILDIACSPIPPEYQHLISRVGFEGERLDVLHSQYFDKSMLAFCINPESYTHTADRPLLGPDRRSFELLRQTPCLLSSFGELARERFPGIQLIDVGAGSPEGIATWAELFNAKACIYIDKAYQKNTYERRGNMDFYRLQGDALHLISQLPDNMGSFHISAMQLIRYYESYPDGRAYLRALLAEIFKKTSPGGLFMVGNVHCDIKDRDVIEAGFQKMDIPVLKRGFEPLIDAGWRKNYQIYQKSA